MAVTNPFNALVTSLKDAPHSAVGDGVADDTAAIRSWAAVGGELIVPPGTYLFDNSTTSLTEIVSNSKITFSPGAKIKFTSQSNAGITISSKSDITLLNPTLEGLPGVTTGADGVFVQSSNNVTIRYADISQFNGIAIKMESCSRCEVVFNRLHNNSVYGIQDKLGANNDVSNNWLYSNGRTDSGTNAIGRGLVTWMVADGNYSYNKCYDNTEYGLRIYSQTGDASPTENCEYIGNRCYGNGTTSKIEFYIYNESGMVQDCVIADNVITYDGTVSNIGMSCQGTRMQILNNKIINSTGDQSGTAYQLYKIFDSTIAGGIVKGAGNVLSVSGTAGAIPDGITIDGIRGIDVASFIPSITYYGANAIGYTITNNKANHAGAGTDTALVLTAWTDGQFEVHNNHFDGFDKGITIGNSYVNLSNNSTINSTTQGCEVLTTSSANVEFFGNRWDKCYPASKCNMSVGKIGGVGSRITSSNTIPSSDSRLSPWDDGDFCHKTTVAVDGNGRIQIGWICTVAGTGGTWEPVWASQATWV